MPSNAVDPQPRLPPLQDGARKQSGITLTEDEIKEGLGQIDDNNDGKIDRDELMSLLHIKQAEDRTIKRQKWAMGILTAITVIVGVCLYRTCVLSATALSIFLDPTVLTAPAL